MQADQLSIGEKFTIPGLSNMRNLVCLRISPTAVHISGEERLTSQDPWKAIKNPYIACSTPVSASGELVDISHNKNNQLIISGGVEKKKRGRKGTKIIFPKEKFTINDLAEKLGCSNTHIYLKVKELVKKGEIQEFEEKRKKGQRGKPKKSYKILNYIHSNKK